MLDEAAGAPAELGLPAWIGVLRVHQGRPTEALATLEPMLGAEARRGGQGYWVEHTLQMTAHAYGPARAQRRRAAPLDRLEHEIERRGTGVRYAGLQHTYRSWILRNLGDPGGRGARAAPGSSWPTGQEIRAQCQLDVADCLLRAGDLAGAAERLAVAETGVRGPVVPQQVAVRPAPAAAAAPGWRWPSRDAAAALDAAEPVVAAAEERGDARYAVLGRLVRATAQARLGPRRSTTPRLAADLDQLAEVAALEGWWLAADVADATGSAHARAVADAAGRARRPRGRRARRGVPAGRTAVTALSDAGWMTAG